MSLISLLVRNLVRQRMRTALTVVGIAVGITIVVALGAITGGLEKTAGAMIREGGADFIVAQKGAADLSFSSISEEEHRRVAALPGVARTRAVLVHVTRYGDNPFFPLLGVAPAELAEAPPEVLSGRLLAEGAAGEIVLGENAAEATGATPGEPVEIDGRAFRVVGVYRSGNLFYDGGAYAPLATVGELARRPKTVTLISVTAAEGVEPAALAATIEDTLPGVTTVADVSEYGKVDQGMKVLDAINVAVSALAIGLGTIAIMNTMIMAVFERTREFGILRALGWRGSRILRLVLGEAVLLCLVAAAAGTALGVLASRAVLLIDAVRNFLEPTYDVGIFVRAVVIALAVGLIGALYPAYRAVRLSPMEALRHE